MLSIYRDESGQTILDVKGCTTMTEVKALKMANMGFAELDTQIFKKLPNLEEIDISGNMLKRIPAELYLPKVKKLNCSNNQLSDVLFLEQFPHLEELYMTDNKLTFADQCIAAYICRDLKLIDKRAGADIDVGRLNMKIEKRLEPVIDRVWDLYFARSYKKTTNSTDLMQLEKDFCYHVKRTELYRPKLLEKFRDYKLSRMVKDYLSRLGESMKTVNFDEVQAGCSSTASAITVPDTPTVEKQTTTTDSNKDESVVDNSTVEVEEPVQVNPTETVETVETSTAVVAAGNADLPDDRPPKRKRVTFEGDDADSEKTDVVPVPVDSVVEDGGGAVEDVTTLVVDVEEGTDAMAKNSGKDYSRKRPSDDEEELSCEDAVEEVAQDMVLVLPIGGSITELPALRGADPLFLLRCHSQTEPADNTTQVWKCAFEPDPSSPGNTTNAAATCGGAVVCLIDCMTGLVHKSYTHPQQDEDFMALAWTTVELALGNFTKRTNLLAVAGCLKEIRIFHPEHLTFYGSIKAHTMQINSLSFHPSNSTWLFSGSEDKTIMLWEISVISCSDCSINYSNLMIFNAGMEILNMLVSDECGFLVAGCKGGCFGWRLPENESNQCKTIEPCVKFQLPLTISDDVQQQSIVDGLVHVADDLLATKCTSQGCIVLWRLKDTMKNRSLVESEMLTVSTHIVAVLEWSNTSAICTGPNCHLGYGILSYGDDQGQVWIYNLKPLLKMTPADFDAQCRYAPSVVLQCVADETSGSSADGTGVAVNSTAVSGCGEYLVAVTSNNNVSIWALTL